MRDAEFREWLSSRSYQGRSLTQKGVNNRVRKAPRIERALPELGFSEPDLDAVHASGKWPQLVQAVKDVAADWRSHEAAARRMAPQAPDPTRQLSNLINVARQYGHFADGKDPNYDADTDGDDPVELDEEALARLRERLLASFPDFESGGGFPGRSSYHEAEDDYKRALIAKVGEALAGNPTPRAIGDRLLELLLDDREMNLVGDYRRKGHLINVRSETGGAFAEAVGQLALADGDPAAAASSFVEKAWPMVLKGSEQSKPFSDIRVLATLPQALARPEQAVSVVTRRWDNLSSALRGRNLFGGDVLNADEYSDALDLAHELFDVMEAWGWRPRDMWDVQGFVWETCKEKLDMNNVSVADQVRQYALENYIEPARARGDSTAVVRSGDIHNALGLSNSHANVCQALRGQKFQDLAGVTVPGFEGPDNSSTTTFTYQLSPADSQALTERSTPGATNLILYGPPGTGKTYRTAAESVRLCDGLTRGDPLLTDPVRREELRQRYDQLVDAGQIKLVTFHQSYSYEDFVEGLRPVTESGAEGDEASSGVGFRLEPKRGIFREICAVAEDARRNAGRGGGFNLEGRKLFKMSLGRAGIEDHIYDAAIDGSYVVLGWGGDIDWSNPRFEEWSAVLSRWQVDHPEATGNDPNVVQLWPLRSAMQEGDLVIVSAGNSHFRAIGEVVGPYRYEPTGIETYNHRRPVRWLLLPEEPLPVDMIYGKNFMMQSCYQLKDGLVKKEALKRLLPGKEASRGDHPDQFVLIIDEINRANISKVFGELITLIEADKRLGSGPESLQLQLPYSGERFGVPCNLHLVGTMNTADRSIALLDTALRRRFVFEEVEPDASLLPAESHGVPLRQVLQTMNDRIEYLVDRERRIGHALFMGDGGCSRAAIDRTMRDKVIPLLQEYFFEDWARVAAVLGEQRGSGGAFLDCRKLPDPTGQDGEERESWSVRKEFAYDAYDRLIGRIKPEAPAEGSIE